MQDVRAVRKTPASPAGPVRISILQEVLETVQVQQLLVRLIFRYPILPPGPYRMRSGRVLRVLTVSERRLFHLIPYHLQPHASPPLYALPDRMPLPLPQQHLRRPLLSRREQGQKLAGVILHPASCTSPALCTGTAIL